MLRTSYYIRVSGWARKQCVFVQRIIDIVCWNGTPRSPPKAVNCRLMSLAPTLWPIAVTGTDMLATTRTCVIAVAEVLTSLWISTETLNVIANPYKSRRVNVHRRPYCYCLVLTFKCCSLVTQTSICMLGIDKCLTCPKTEN